MFFFSTLALAALFSLALFELAQMLHALKYAVTCPKEVRVTPENDLKLVLCLNVKPIPWAVRAQMFAMRYQKRSFLFHEWLCVRHGEEPHYRTFGYGILVGVGTVGFTAVGFPLLTAVGLGVAGALVAFFVTQLQNVLCYSDYCEELDNAQRNAELRLVAIRAARK